MHYTSRERGRASWLRRELLLDFLRMWILDLSDFVAGCISGMAGIYAARLVPDKGQKSDEKTGRKNTSRAVAVAAYIQQEEEKRGHPSPHSDYWVELKCSRALLAPQPQHHQCNSGQLMKRLRKTTQQFQLLELTLHILVLSRGNVKMLHGRIFSFIHNMFEEKGIFLIFPLSPLSESGLVD